ncbi:hypothetical protein COCON_G00010960 [Conger conger]|uniref:Ribosomal protein eL8/eL30/eS12/Gadd45 domain-containing protein n=1 Tax=Conger conger TaxID=82655 RepID=A0A9Q1E2I9_CONCO|nr:ribonuclease P protein subunit p38 [Conger conger]KAJ8288437.1 hypothetical protein COCON_G00010960 [Conger conger]
MAASCKGGKKEKKRPIPVKTSLNSPYSLQWNPLEREDMHFILNLLKENMAEVGLQKREGVKKNRKWGKKREQPAQENIVDEHSQKVDIQGGLPLEGTYEGWTDLAARKQLAIGINEVTRALERNELCLVLVCKSVKPEHMTNHLIMLSKTRTVPACQVPRLSENMAHVLGLKCVLALGFKRNTPLFSHTVSAIIPKVPPFQVPWIPVKTKTQESTKGGQTDELENGNKSKGQKRKIEDAASVDYSPVLQCLKVKKIIPNPSKIRKLKNKRKK